MSRSRLRSLLAGVVLAAALGLPPSWAAAETWVSGKLFYGIGYRHSLTQDLGGLDFRVGAGVGLGPLGMTLSSSHTTDHTFSAADRVAGRITNWLSLSVSIPLPGPLSLAFGGGPGLASYDWESNRFRVFAPDGTTKNPSGRAVRAAMLAWASTGSVCGCPSRA